MKFIKHSCIITILSLLLILYSCNNKLSATYTIEEQSEFGNIFIHTSIEDFEKLGFNLGDSIDVSFSNGIVLKDIPYYSGFYIKSGEYLVYANPYYEYLAFSLYYGNAWSMLKVNNETKVTLTLNTPKKYLNVEQTMSLRYSSERDDFSTDSQFANFRACAGGNLKNNYIYRSSSLINNVINRVSYSDQLSKDNNIMYILDLADSEENINNYNSSYDCSSLHFMKLKNDNRVALLALTADYNSIEFKTSLGNGLKKMINYPGPYMIHCTEGKDRTGFVCALLEALAFSSYEEIEKDYMLSFYNFYGVDEIKDNTKYSTLIKLNFLPILYAISGMKDNISSIELANGAVRYLKACNMNDEEINRLRDAICITK